MRDRSLSSVMEKIADAVSLYPELADSVFAFLFESQTLREGLALPLVGVAVTDAPSLKVELRPSAQLEQFAHAVSHGVVPEMALQSATVGD